MTATTAGFSNAALWPLFHYRLDLMNFTRRDLAAYRRVNALLAHGLARLLRPSDMAWVRDYHLIPMAEELRRTGPYNGSGSSCIRRFRLWACWRPFPTTATC